MADCASSGGSKFRWSHFSQGSRALEGTAAVSALPSTASCGALAGGADAKQLRINQQEIEVMKHPVVGLALSWKGVYPTGLTRINWLF